MARANLGLEIMKTRASFTGPADWVRAYNFERGIAASDLPGFLPALIANRPMPASTGTAGEPPKPLTFDSALGTLATGGTSSQVDSSARRRPPAPCLPAAWPPSPRRRSSPPVRRASPC